MLRTRLLSLVALFALVVSRAVVAAESSAPEYPPPAEVKAAFLKLLDRPRVPADPQLQSTTSSNGLTIEHLSIATERKANGTIERLPILLAKPAKSEQRLPVVIVMHGTGGNKEKMLPKLERFARAGVIGLAIDARYHGERAGGGAGSAAYVAAITRAWKTPDGQPQEHPFYYDTCWDVWRLLDYLEQRPDIDPQRIGMWGISMGGMQTWLAGAVDDRVRVAVPAISAQSFRWSLEHEAWQGRARTIKAAHEQAAKDLGETEVNARVCRALWNKVIPGMLDQFDCPSMMRLFADRPLLITSGELDSNCPLEGAKLAFAQAERSHADAGASDKLQIDVAAGAGHQITAAQEELIFAWFERWLKP